MSNELREKYYFIHNRLEKCAYDCDKCLDSNGQIITSPEKYKQLCEDRERLSKLCLASYQEYRKAFLLSPFDLIMDYFFIMQTHVKEPRVVYYGMHCVEGYLGGYATEADFYSAIVYLSFITKMTAPTMKPATEDDEFDELCRKAITYALTLTNDEKQEYCERHLYYAKEAYNM
jgi:hypothetical protein